MTEFLLLHRQQLLHLTVSQTFQLLTDFYKTPHLPHDLAIFFIKINDKAMVEEMIKSGFNVNGQFERKSKSLMIASNEGALFVGNLIG